MGKTRIAIIELLVDSDEETITTKIEGKSGVLVSTVAENLYGLLEGMIKVIEKNPEAKMGGFDKDYQKAVTDL